MSGGRSSSMAWWSAATILVSAFLLFQVQPVISKKILPWFGGSPAVWTTCVLFFQVLLLGGYAYAHWLIRFVRPGWQGIVHISVLILAVLTLPIIPSDWWKPADGNYPALRILLLLAAEVGPPYFVLATTGPLVQAWFSQLYPGRSPYRLYALSNVGSLAALLTYPFLIETTLRVDTQGTIWSFGFVVFAGLIGIMALTMWRELTAEVPQAASESIPDSARPTVADYQGPKSQTTKEPSTSAGAEPFADQPPSAWLQSGWLALAALGSMALLAITNHLCQDIAVVPFMWVIPLSLYLLSFIICFDNERWYVRKLFGTATAAAILWLCAVRNYTQVDNFMEWAQKPVKDVQLGMGQYSIKLPLTFSKLNDSVLEGIGWLVSKTDQALHHFFKPSFHLRFNVHTYDFTDHVFAVSTAFLLVLFLICMVCHGELVKSKPRPKYLTSFYLFISAGGALGGLFVALICPLIFKMHFELALTLMGGFVAASVALANDGRQQWLKNREVLQWCAAFVIVGGLMLVAKGSIEEPDKELIAIDRNFYGTIKVTKMEDAEDPSNNGRALYNGRIWHGFQYLDPARQLEPTTYYVAGTGAALAVNSFPLEMVLPTSKDEPQTWRFTTDMPAEGWEQAEFDDAGWTESPGGFGEALTPKPGLHTVWTTSDIWLRRTFDVTESNSDGLTLVIQHEADVEVFLNGQQIAVRKGFTNKYVRVPLDAQDAAALRAGKNTLAIHGHHTGGGGQYLDAGLGRRRHLRVAVIGLGTGSMAAHGRAGDMFRFYDIDPKVVKVAHEYFTYLDKSPAKPEVILGDARISLERELKEHGSNNYDIIHLDAFSGDAIPAHLLTAESFALYEQHLRKDASGKPVGIIVVHISNRYLDLEPVVAAIARKYDYQTVNVHKSEDGGFSDTGSDWILVTKNEKFLHEDDVEEAGEKLAPDKEILWTDQFTALFPILK